MKTASINWINNTPYSTDFNDFYFSSDGGEQEVEYVFVAGNQLIERFQSLREARFTIIETGFGTGLNFLCCAQHWLNHAPPGAQLHYISIEKFPLSTSDWLQVQQQRPQYATLCDALSSHYPNLNAGLNRMYLAERRIQIDLWLGDVDDILARLEQKTDAWLLDGFAPAKNPHMWSAVTFAHMAHLSKIGSTFATFTSAGNVRRGLQQAGFEVIKQAGFGKKREMLTGRFVEKS